MPYEKLYLNNNKDDIIEDLVKEIDINNRKGDNNKNYVNNLKNILQSDTNFRTKFTTYNNETLLNAKKRKPFINQKRKRK